MMFFAIRRLVRAIKREVGAYDDENPDKRKKTRKANQKRNQINEYAPAIPLSPPGTDLRPTLLPLPEPLPDKNDLPWNVIKKKPFGDARTSIAPALDGQLGMRVDYVPQKAGSKSGYGFFAIPPTCFPANEVAFGYQVYFPHDFDFVRGGKLPGIFIGSPGASGGNWEANAGSVRVMWGRDNGDGTAVATAYLYIPTQVCPCGTKASMLQTQGPNYCSITHETKMGHHVWNKGPFKFKKGQWNSVYMRVRMNTPGYRNGSLEIKINDVYQRFDEMIWRSDPNLFFEGLSMMTFFGGHTKEFEVPRGGAHCIFKDFTVWSVPR